jgi:hypothetical protein
MAENAKVGIDLVADTRSLRTQLRESVQELARLQNTAGASAKEIANAAKRAAELKDRIGDAKATIEAFNPDAKFKAFGQSIQGVAGAFAGAQGALALFGVESENVQKQLLKVQGALAFSEGLNTIIGSIDGFKNLALVIKTQVINAFTTLRGAIIATGIGAAAIALGLLIANFDKVKEAILKAIPGLGDFADAIGNIVTKVTDFVGITSETDRALELYAKNSKGRKEQYERELKALESQGASEKVLSEKRKQIANEDINVLEAKKRNGIKLKDDETKQLADSKNDLIVIEGNYKKSVLATQKKGDDEYLKNQNERIDKEIANESARIDRLNAIAEAGLAPDDLKVLKVRQQLDADLLLFADNEKLKAELVRNSEEEIDKIRRKSKQVEVKELKDSKNIFDVTQTDKTKAVTGVLNAMNKSITKTKEDAEKEIALSNAVKQTRIRNLSAIGDALGALSGMAEQGSALQKGLALGQVAIDTAVAISSLTANSEANPANAVTFGGAGVIQFATGLLRILSNIAQAKAILSQVPGGASAGPSISISAPAAPIEPSFTPNAPTQLDQTSLNAIGNVAARAYVVESDITDSQKRIQRIENSARI